MREEKLLLFTLLGVLFLRFISLGAYPLMDKTESRYAEIAREMVATNNWITPQTDPGVAFWAKPPLSIWATAICINVFGASEFSARFAAFLFLTFTIFLVYLVGKNLKGVVFGLEAALILTTIGLFYFLLGGVMTDPAFASCITLSMVAFFLTLRATDKSSRLRWGYLFFIGIGLSILAKGLLGLFFILGPVCLWKLFFKRRQKIFSRFPLVSGFLLLLLIAVPWHVMAEMRTPGFLKYYIIGEHFERFIVPGWKGDMYGEAHKYPKGMIWIFLIPATLPWTVIFISNFISLLKKKISVRPIINDDGFSYFSLFFITPLVCFTLAGNILMTYLLPSLPAFALLTTYLMRINRNLAPPPAPWFVNPKTIIIFAIGVSVPFTVAAFTIVPKVAAPKSHKAIVSSFNNLNTSTNASLVYLKETPFSADFYIKGKTVGLGSTWSASTLEERLHKSPNDFYVLYKEDEGRVSANIWKYLHQVGDFGEYSLYKTELTFP